MALLSPFHRHPHAPIKQDTVILKRFIRFLLINQLQLESSQKLPKAISAKKKRIDHRRENEPS